MMRSIVRVSLLSLCVAAAVGCKKKPADEASKGSAAGSGSAAVAGSAEAPKGSDTPAGSGSAAAAGSGSSADSGSAAAKTLFARLGGVDGIKGILDETFKNIAADKRLSKRFEKVDTVELEKKVIDLLCMATKGPCEYKGLSVADAHKGLKITEAEFGAFAEDVGKALDAKGVQKAEKDELFALVGPLKADVVGH